MEISQKSNVILQCFVDMNLETNENLPYDINVLEVSIEKSFYTTSEGKTLRVVVELSEPSVLGIEEADVILANISTSSGDTSGTFPIHLKWERGEQQKELNITVNSDFIEEQTESFVLGLANLVNLDPGSFVRSTVSVADTTDLRSISILSAGRTRSMTILDGSQNSFQRGVGNTINIGAIEGELTNIVIGLDQPSQHGIEKVKVSLSSPSDFNLSSVIMSSTLVEWAVGERFKTILVSIPADRVLDGVRTLNISLYEAENSKIANDSPLVRIDLMDVPVARRFAIIDMGRIFKQRGSALSSNDAHPNDYELSLRVITDNQITNINSLYWLVEIGTNYIDNSSTYSLSESANYSNWPNYDFGVFGNRVDSVVYLRVTNLGIDSVEYDNIVRGAGESFDIPMVRGNTSVTLQTNDDLVLAGTIHEGESIQEDTYLSAKYKLEIIINLPQLPITGQGEAVAAPHGFVLKTTSAIQNSYFIGEFSFPNLPTAREAYENKLLLISSYKLLRTTFDGTSCYNLFDGPGKVHNVRINGLILLSQNSLSSDYLDHTFLPEGEFSPNCLPIAGSSNNLGWVSVPFEKI